MKPVVTLLLLLCLSPVTLASGNMLNGLLTQRLALMKDVAAYKWLHNLPVEDTAREDVVIRTAVVSGLRHQLTKAFTEGFFQAQIHAAKDIQSCWFDRWQQGAAPDFAPDLDQHLRPKLLALGNRIMTELGTTSASLPAAFVFDVECLSGDAAARLGTTLKGIRFYESRYRQIQDSGYLRVGTTGDYMPFSYAEDDDAFDGIDIELAGDLAQWLNVKLLLVKTSWPGLTEDLVSGRYDIAMSGVSIIEQRKQFGIFSSPYHVGGKTPISRCERTSEFDSLAAIDQPGVRLIVNPGGTNERFIDNHVQNATKILHDDNRTIFDAIVNGQADLMITDQIEARLQAGRYAALCQSMPGTTLTYQEKGYLMVRDEQLHQKVEAWLAQRLSDGTIAGVFATYLDR